MAFRRSANKRGRRGKVKKETAHANWQPVSSLAAMMVKEQRLDPRTGKPYTAQGALDMFERGHGRFWVMRDDPKTNIRVIKFRKLRDTMKLIQFTEEERDYVDSMSGKRIIPIMSIIGGDRTFKAALLDGYEPKKVRRAN